MKMIRGNHKSFITKNLRKTIMKRSALKKRANISNNPEIIKLYKKQRNYVVNLSRKVKTEYFQKHMPHGASTKNFWKFCKPFFSNKTTNFHDKIILVEKGEAVSKNEEIATHFNNYFNYITKGLNIKKWCISEKLSDDPLVSAIRKYENYPSIIKIKSSVETTELFDFNFVSSDDIYKIINSLNPTKKTSGAIPTKIVKLANKQICKDLANCINECIQQNKFPNELKIADIMPIFKKENDLISQKQSGFRPGDSCINQLLSINHEILSAFDIGLEVRWLFLDISKAFDKVWHAGLIYKLRQNGICGDLINILNDFLTNRKERVVLNGQCLPWDDIRAGVPQGSILGPLLFLMYVNDLPNGLKSECKLFADDTSLFSVAHDLNTSASDINDDLKLTGHKRLGFSVKIIFNPDPSKQAQELIFSRKKMK